MCSGPIPQHPPTIVAPAAIQRRASSRYASGVTSSRMSCRPALAADAACRARRRWRRRRSAARSAPAASATAGSITSGWLQLNSTTSAPRCSAACAASTTDSPDRRRGSSSTSSSCERERDPQRRRLAVGVEHVADEPDLGDRRLRLRQPEIDEWRLLEHEHVEDRARLLADEQVGPVRAEHRRQAAGDADAGMAVGDLARDRRRQRASAGRRRARTTRWPRWNGTSA